MSSDVERVREAMAAERRGIESAILDGLAKHGELYSTQLWDHWVMLGGDENRRRGWSKVQQVLKSMRDRGLVASRLVTPSDHKGSTLLRRYYRLRQAE